MCELTLDPNTAHRSLRLLDQNRTVSGCMDEMLYPDHPHRFRTWKQVMCQEALSGRHYWEAVWGGSVFGVNVGVTYEGISRTGEASVSLAGHNDASWSLHCSNYSYSALHGGKIIDLLKTPESNFHSETVAVHLDWPAGTLSFYRVSGNTLTHIYTFRAEFTEPVYPVFRLVHYDAVVSLNLRTRDRDAKSDWRTETQSKRK